MANRGMFVFVVRWCKRIDGEEECGNFEVCYTDEELAKAAMLKDFEDTKADWGKDVTESVRMELTQTDDYCSVQMTDGSYDYHEWWIDKLELVSEM